MIKSITAYGILILSIFSICSCQKQAEYDSDFVQERLNQVDYSTPDWWAFLDSLIVEYPDEAFPYYRKGLQLVRENNYIEGMPLMERAAELNPYMYANYVGSIKLVNLADYEGAIELFQTAIRHNNHVDIVIPGSAYERLGITYKEMGNYEKSISTFDAYIKEFGEDGVDLYTFMYNGIAKYNIGDFDGAMKDFDTIIRKWEKCPEAYYHKGIVYKKQGNNSLACKQFKKALLYQNFIRGSPSGTYIDQLYVVDIERMFDSTCRE